MTQPLALIVDDEPDICELLAITLGRMDITTHAAENVTQARDLLDQHPFDICLTDMRLPDGSGIDLVKHIHNYHPHIPTAVITAHGNMETAIEALKAGAFDFVSKPVDLGILRNLVKTALKLSSHRPPRKLHIQGSSAAVQKIRQLVAKVARSQAPVYISGESGTGKELVARMIHEQGPRTDGPFIPVNCGAIPSELMESEFFGHKKGSFTGAIADKQGLFSAADGGTLFLDEIADLPMGMQVKLLRAIQEKTIRPVGSPNETQVDVRILSATHKDLQKLVTQEVFRQDLFYRINVIELNVPPLRKRCEDIPELTQSILERMAVDHGSNPIELTKEALTALCNYLFPGNVRELENILERAVALCDEDQITASDLQLPQPSDINSEINNAVSEASSTPEERTLNDEPLESFMDSMERDKILSALDANRWNRTAAAKQLGITLRILRYRLKKLGLD